MVQNRTAIFANHFTFGHGTQADYSAGSAGRYLNGGIVLTCIAFLLNKIIIRYDNKSTVQTCALFMGRSQGGRESVQQAFSEMALAFGGMDILVNNAGISISKSIAEYSLQEWDLLYDILVKGQFIVSKNAASVLRSQGMGGDIINIVSKNAVVAGPNNPGYGSAKAAQSHLTRLMTAELGPDNVRVNAINPDAVIAGSNIWAGGWAEGRAKAYGITVE